MTERVLKIHRGVGMRKSICLATVCLSASVFAQNPPNPPPQSAQPQQPAPKSSQTTPPSTAPASRTERITQGIGNVFSDYRLEDLPQAAQKTVREQVGANKIADIDRETRTGRTVWEIEVEQEGRNREFHVGEDGTLVTDSGLLGRAADETAARTREVTGTGAAAGAQKGRSALSMGPKWEDLPPAVQQKAMQFGGKEKVADIDRETENGRLGYEIEFRREGRNLEVEFAEDGSITESNDPAAAPVGASAATGAARRPVTTQPGQTPQTTQPTPGQPIQPTQPSPPRQ